MPVQISAVAGETLNIIHYPSQFTEPLLYFENLDHEGLWGELAHSLYINKKDGSQKYWIEKTKEKLSTDFASFVDQNFSAIASFDYFYSFVVNHGIFADRFFEIEVNQVLSNELTKQTYSLDFYKKLVSDHYTTILGREMNANYLSNYSAVASKITSQLTTQYVFSIVNDAEKMKGAAAWWIKYKRKRKCIFCGKEFSLVTLPDWVYFGSNGFKRCCFHCNIVQFPNDTEIGHAVRDFLDVCAFIPSSDFHPTKYSFTSRLTQEQWIEAIWAYAKMGGINFLRKKYGSWINCLLITGAMPEGVRVSTRGIYCLAKDGHLCNSLAEQQIDNWLLDNNVAHDKEPLYPYHPLLNPNRKKRADWIVGEKIIEFFGLPEDPSYAKKMSEKILLAKTFGLELISIFPKDLSNLTAFLRKHF